MTGFETLRVSTDPDGVTVLLADGKEGVAAFREKRAPRFTGRACDLPDLG